MGKPCAELYLRHHWPPQGRRLSPPRRLSDDHGHTDKLAHDALQPCVYGHCAAVFHCNGWNHTWMMPLLGGTVVGCRDISAKAIYDGIADERVSHFGGAPIVLNMIVNAEDGERRNLITKLRSLPQAPHPLRPLWPPLGNWVSMSHKSMG